MGPKQGAVTKRECLRIEPSRSGEMQLAAADFFFFWRWESILGHLRLFHRSTEEKRFQRADEPRQRCLDQVENADSRVWVSSGALVSHKVTPNQPDQRHTTFQNAASGVSQGVASDKHCSLRLDLAAVLCNSSLCPACILHVHCKLALDLDLCLAGSTLWWSWRPNLFARVETGCTTRLPGALLEMSCCACAFRRRALFYPSKHVATADEQQGTSLLRRIPSRQQRHGLVNLLASLTHALPRCGASMHRLVWDCITCVR